MRCITYAGETVVTTDDIAEALITLTAAVANHGASEVLTIPIIDEDTHQVGDAKLVVGIGNDVLSAPIEWPHDVPDFSDAAAALRAHRLYPTQLAEDPENISHIDSVSADWDPDLHGAL